MSPIRLLTSSLAGLIVASLLSGCGSGSSADSRPAITVSVEPDSTTVQVGGTQLLTATVRNDSAQMGVSWAIAPATGAGSLTAMTGTSVTYQAPASSPSTDLTVTVTATSVADHARTASVTITVPAAPLPIEVVITPPDAVVEPNGSQSLLATVQNDPTHAGVSWTISPESGAGELTDDDPGTSVTYHAPARPAASDLIVTITATSVADHASSASATITVPAMVVSIEPASATVLAGNSQMLTATVLHDPSQAGVTWTIDPEQGAGTLRDRTGTSAIFDAPAAPLAEAVTATITATAAADETVAGSATITVPVIDVGIDPTSALIPASGIQAFQATVDFDPNNRGVSWSLTSADAMACSPACGSLSEIDPLHATFTAPPAVSAKSTVTLTATSMTDPTRSASASITLSTGGVQLVPANLPFADTKASANGTWKKTLLTTLTNAGNMALDIAGVSIASQHFSADSHCGVRVEIGGSCDIDVTFAPRAVGIFRADLVIRDSSSDSPQQIPLSGQGCRNLRPCAPFTVIQSVLANTAALVAPAPTGPNRVGTRTIDLVDRTRDDPYLANGTKRELLVRFWYPASVKRDCRPAPYAAPAVWKYLSNLAGVPAPTVRTNSCADARILDGAYPVVVFTHGYTGMLTDYTFLFEELASRGYLVASIGHTYESTAVSFPDGRFVRSVLGTLLTTVPIDERTISLAESARLEDVSFVLDELPRLNTRSDSPLVGHLDTANIAIAGHSLGGLTALQAIAREPRIRAAVVLDGVAIDGDTWLTDTPVLIVDAGREQWSADERQLWGRLRGPRFAINLKDAAHAAPSDLVWIAKGAVATGSMTSEQAVAATRDYVAAFLDASLLGKPVDPLLVQPSKRYPHVDVKRPNP